MKKFYPDKLWILLWSPKQRCFHIETFKDYLEASWRMMTNNRPVSDYFPIAYGPSKESMHIAAGGEGLRECLNAAADAKDSRQKGSA